MGKELTTRENTDVALSKSKSFMGIIKNIFNNKVVPEDDSWMQNLWDWADENDIADDVEPDGSVAKGSLPRDKGQLLAMIELDLSWKDLPTITKEIGKLTHLQKLDLSGNEEIEPPKELWNLINLQELNLNGTDLKVLPKEIGNLTNLEILRVDNTSIDELPSEIKKLINLKELFASDNDMIKLPNAIWELFNLTKLSISADFNDGIPPKIGNLTNLIFLRLENCYINVLPNEIFNLRALEILNLNTNNLEDLPDDIGNLINLTMLVLDNNNLEYLSEDIGKLKELTYLGLDNNILFMLPNTIGDLTNLEALSLQNNTLDDIPDEICSLKKLTSLDIRGNFEIALPSCFQILFDNSKGFRFRTNDEDEVKIYSDSTSLDVSETEDWMQRLWGWADENDISDLEWVDDEDYDDGGYWEGFPRNKENLLKIKKLHPGFSLIDYLPKEIGNLTSLVEFHLDFSNISELPKEIGSLINLKKFKLESNIKYLPREIGNLISLEDLSLERSNLVELPKEIGNLANLRNLNLSYNNLTELPREIGKLENLQDLNLGSSSLSESSLDNNNLSELPREIGNLINLRKLDLQFNNIVELPKEIGNLINLTELYLWRNDLTELPKEIGELSNLEVLNLWSNNIKKLPEEIVNLKNLAWIYLDNNYLTVLPQNIGRLTNLLGLCIENNDLTELPNSICNLQNLEVLKLGNNPLTLTNEQKAWIRDLINNNCDVYLDEDILETSLETIEREELQTNNSSQTKFDMLIKKIYARDYELGTCFEQNIKYEDYIDDKLMWTSDAKGVDKEIIDTHWGVINMFVKEIFGYETEVIILNDATEDDDTEYEELTYGETYNNVDFDESDMSIAISRSIAANSDWVFLHTNLNGAIKWLEDDDWEKQDNGVYIYPFATDDGKYKNMEVGFDSNNFPILRAGLMEQGKTFENSLEPYNQYTSIKETTQDNDFDEGVFQLTKLLEKEAVSREAVLEFILGELDGASQGNEYAIDFVKNSGFRQEEYTGAMTNASDEADAIHLALHSALLGIDDIDFKVKLSTSVLDNMMKKYSLGKYAEDEVNLF